MATKYIVYVREVYVQANEVFANSPEEAKALVEACEGEILEDCLEYSHTLDKDSWTVEKCNHQEADLTA